MDRYFSDSLVNEKERYKQISDDMVETLADLSSY